MHKGEAPIAFRLDGSTFVLTLNIYNQRLPVLASPKKASSVVATFFFPLASPHKGTRPIAIRFTSLSTRLICHSFDPAKVDLQQSILESIIFAIIQLHRDASICLTPV